MKKIISVVVVIVFCIVLFIGSALTNLIVRDNEHNSNNLMGAYVLYNFEEDNRIIWTFDGYDSMVQSTYGYYRIENKSGLIDVILSSEQEKGGISLRDTMSSTTFDSLINDMELFDEMYLFSIKTMHDSEPEYSYVFAPNGTYELRTEYKYTFNKTKLIIQDDVWEVSKTPYDDSVYLLNYTGTEPAITGHNMEFLTGQKSLVLVPLEKNFDYEFYAVESNENHVVAFMPEHEIFTFEKGTYSFDNSNNVVKINLHAPSGEEIYNIENVSTEGLRFVSAEKSVDFETTGDISEFLKGAEKGVGDFEYYISMEDLNSRLKITFNEDGTFVRYNQYSYAQHMGTMTIIDYAENIDASTDSSVYYQTFNFTCNEQIGTINLNLANSVFPSPHVSYQLTRIDQFDDSGIEAGSFEGMTGIKYSYKRVITACPSGNSEDTIYRVIYTNDLEITGEQISHNSLSGTFIPIEEKNYELLHVW